MRKKPNKIDWTSPKILKRIFELTKANNTQIEIAESLGVSRSTFQKQLYKKDEVLLVYNKGLELSTSHLGPIVESKFLKEMTGYTTKEKTITRKHVGFEKDSKGKDILTKPIYVDEPKIVEKYHRPNITALIFYMVNKLGFKSINNVKSELDLDKLKIEFDILEENLDGMEDEDFTEFSDFTELEDKEDE